MQLPNIGAGCLIWGFGLLIYALVYALDGKTRPANIAFFTGLTFFTLAALLYRPGY